ncbi:MAG: hypothetical protein WD361_03905, partial [Gracilimonas sp.]
YAREAIQGRFPAGERAIASDPAYAYMYAFNVIEGRFPEGEATIASDPTNAFYYAKNVIQGEWPEGEKAIATKPAFSYEYAKNIIQGRWPEGEKAIATDPNNAYLYAKNVIQGRWPEGEKTLAKDPGYAVRYAHMIINGRFPEAEPAIATSAETSYEYARYVLHGRFPAGEEAIADHPRYAREYKEYIDILRSQLEVKEDTNMDNRDELFQRTANAQRGTPEKIMVGLQHKMGGGVYSVIIEHVGDITHRISEYFSQLQGQQENVKEKVTRGLRYLNHPYGFEKEMQQNMRNNYNFYVEEKGMTKSFNEWTNEIKEGCKRYAEAHKKIPVWNEPQLWAREAAIAIGLWDFDTARLYLEKLKKITDLSREQYVEAVGQMTLTEAPIKDIKTYGMDKPVDAPFSSKHKPNQLKPSMPELDIKMLGNPNYWKVIKKKFEKTPFNINLVFANLNLPSLMKTGEMSTGIGKDFSQTFYSLLSNYSGRISPK